MRSKPRVEMDPSVDQSPECKKIWTKGENLPTRGSNKAFFTCVGAKKEWLWSLVIFGWSFFSSGNPPGSNGPLLLLVIAFLLCFTCCNCACSLLFQLVLARFGKICVCRFVQSSIHMWIFVSSNLLWQCMHVLSYVCCRLHWHACEWVIFLTSLTFYIFSTIITTPTFLRAVTCEQFYLFIISSFHPSLCSYDSPCTSLERNCDDDCT